MHTLEFLFCAYQKALRTAITQWCEASTFSPYVSVRTREKRDKETNRIIGTVLIIRVHCPELLGKVNMEESDIPLIETVLNAYLIGSPIKVCDLFVNQIHPCYNAVIPDEKERDLLMWLFKKGIRKVKGFTQRDGDSNTGNTLYFYSDGGKKDVVGENKTSKSRSYTIQLYDKMDERKDNDKVALPTEEGVLRLEVQVHRRAVRYISSKGKFSRCYENWVNWTRREEAFRKANLFFYPGDFYSIGRAGTIIRNAGYSSTMCDRIHEFLVSVSRKGMEKASHDYSENTLRKYIGILNGVGVNPVTIPQSKGRSFITNPFRDVLMGGAVNA